MRIRWQVDPLSKNAARAILVLLIAVFPILAALHLWWEMVVWFACGVVIRAILFKIGALPPDDDAYVDDDGMEDYD